MQVIGIGILGCMEESIDDDEKKKEEEEKEKEKRGHCIC